jgi:hypothetical protein
MIQQPVHRPNQPHNGSAPYGQPYPVQPYSARPIPGAFSGRNHSSEYRVQPQPQFPQQPVSSHAVANYATQPDRGRPAVGPQQLGPAAPAAAPGSSRRAFQPGPPHGFPARPEARYTAPPPRPTRPRRKRRLALVVGLLVVAGLAAAGVVLSRTSAEPAGVPATGADRQPATLSVFQLQAGDCYNTAQAAPPPGQSQPVSVVEAVLCTAPHSHQVIGKISYPVAEFPTVVPEAKAEADCNGEFQAKLDPAAFSDPTLKPGRLTPADAATWTRTPVVACVVFSDSPISRSLLR